VVLRTWASTLAVLAVQVEYIPAQALGVDLLGSLIYPIAELAAEWAAAVLR
jgi:hypothetical protein